MSALTQSGHHNPRDFFWPDRHRDSETLEAKEPKEQRPGGAAAGEQQDAQRLRTAGASSVQDRPILRRLPTGSDLRQGQVCSIRAKKEATAQPKVAQIARIEG